MAVVLMSAVSIRENPQDPPRGKKGKKHIKMVKVDENDKKIELDTVIEAGDVFIWNGDTIGGGKEMKWVSKEGSDFDMDMDFDIDEDGKGNVFIMKSGDASAPAVYRFKTDGAHNHEDMIMHAPHTRKMMFIGEGGKGNVIDLSDPGIISYEKKDLKDGKEKITIIRNKPSEKDIEKHEEIIIQGAGSQPMMIHEGHPKQMKRIKVMKTDDGRVEIIEGDDVWSVEEGDSDVQVIEKDGKKITIKKIKEGEEIKVDVEVEEKKEKEEEK